MTMLINKVTEKEQDILNRLFTEFYEKYPELDEDNNFPDNSNIIQITISPFDHWLSSDEAEKEIRGFSNNPAQEVQDRFRQHEIRNVKFLNEYLKSRDVFYVESQFEIVENKPEYHRVFYACLPESDFYHLVNGVIPITDIFLPKSNVFIRVDDDYSIRFELLKISESEITTIVNLAKSYGLHVMK